MASITSLSLENFFSLSHFLLKLELKFCFHIHPIWLLVTSIYSQTYEKWLGGKKFSRDSELISTVNGCFTELNESFYTNGIMALEHRWTKCVKLKGDYIEK